MEFYFQHSLAPSSQRSYTSAQGRYVKFCSLAQVSPFPLSEHNLCRYVSYLAQESVSAASIKCYLSALRHLQIEKNMPDPKISCMPRLEAVIKGIKRTHSRDPPHSKPRLPITPTILLSLRHLWEEDGEQFDNIMLWAACCTCFFGFMRAGEITLSSQDSYDPSSHLSFEDITVDDILNPRAVHLRLKCSKTDPFRLGVTICLGRTLKKLCPVEALLAYLAVRGSKTGFLFHFADGRLLTKALFIAKVREALSRTGLNADNYAGHSFRIGAATTAAINGIDECSIKMLGRWKSSAYQTYIRTPREKLAAFSSVICQPN